VEEAEWSAVFEALMPLPLPLAVAALVDARLSVLLGVPPTDVVLPALWVAEALLVLEAFGDLGDDDEAVVDGAAIDDDDEAVDGEPLMMGDAIVLEPPATICILGSLGS
jgi:hypothetical protein